jgi:hypothetical protein
VFCERAAPLVAPNGPGGAPRASTPSSRAAPNERLTSTRCTDGSAQRCVASPSCRLHNRVDRVHDDLWLIDRDDVTGLLSSYLTAARRQPDPVTLQLVPFRIGAARTCYDDDGNGQLS